MYVFFFLYLSTYCLVYFTNNLSLYITPKHTIWDELFRNIKELDSFLRLTDFNETFFNIFALTEAKPS